MRTLLVVAASFAVFSAGTGTSAAAARTLEIADIARLVNVEEPAISPDGRSVAVVTIRSDTINARYVNSLELVDVATGATRTLVRGRDVAVPRWSPDGTRLAYLARPASESPLQAFVRARGASRQVTHATGDVVDVAWSPDGRQIAFVAVDPPANAAALAKHHDYFFAGNNDYTATALTPPDHLWIVPAAGGRARRLTGGSWTIAPTDPGGIFSPQMAWSPDGRRIAYTRVETPFGGEDEYSTIWTIPAAGGTARKLTQHPSLELSPAFSPDGNRLTYWYARDSNFLAENTVRLLEATHDETLAPSFDRNIAGALWYPDGRRLLVCAADRTQTAAWTIDLATQALQRVPLGSLNMVCDPYSSSTFDAGIAGSIARDGTLAFVATAADRARELYVLPPGAGEPRRLSHYNDVLAGIALGTVRPLDWTGPGGFDEDGVVTYPPAFDAAQPSKKFPIVLLIHGGPGLSNALEFAFETWPLAQLIAARGYVVFQPNYRGSDNLGNAYMLAVVGDTARGPGEDIMAGLTALGKLPKVDASRVAVSGWSYGGLLTTWLIGHYHDWRAAISGAAVNDETEEYNLSISNVQNRYYLGTSPYLGDGQRIYVEQSPITYYRDITTPTLIWGTTLDSVVPITQSYALYHALTDNHVPVRMLVFPASTHGPSNPVQTADLTHFWLDWLGRYL